MLILSGSLLGLIPRFGDVQIDGEVVLLLFLPAILYWESMNTSPSSPMVRRPFIPPR
ncbi:hypothetical protein BN9982_830001 [Mycobacterium tuberculosis]|nr:hypothetical protein BN9982_830001 [Mycobacterium tuberculosis]